MHVMHAFVTEVTFTDPGVFCFINCSISPTQDSEFASKSCLYRGLTH